jgi:hypothetical protein
MKQTFPKAWFATEQRVNSSSRFWNFTDRGSLHFESGILQFIGRKHSLRINDIESIDIISPRVPWLSLVIGIVTIAVCLIFLLTRMPFEFIIMVIIGVALPFLALFIPLLVLGQKAILWIEIAFVDDKNVLRRAYFLDASGLFGWGSMLDNTLKMYRELRSIASVKAS